MIGEAVLFHQKNICLALSLSEIVRHTDAQCRLHSFLGYYKMASDTKLYLLLLFFH